MGRFYKHLDREDTTICYYRDVEDAIADLRDAGLIFATLSNKPKKGLGKVTIWERDGSGYRVKKGIGYIREWTPEEVFSSATQKKDCACSWVSSLLSVENGEHEIMTNMPRLQFSKKEEGVIIIAFPK